MAEMKVCPRCHHTEYYHRVYVSTDENGFRYSAKEGNIPIRVCNKCGLIYAEDQEEVK